MLKRRSARGRGCRLQHEDHGISQLPGYLKTQMALGYEMLPYASPALQAAMMT